MDGFSFDQAHPWNNATEGTPAQALSSKHRRARSPPDSDLDSDGAPLPPHPNPSSLSKAPAKKKKKGSSRKQTDMSAMMRSLMQVLQQHQQTPPSSPESSEELADDVFEEPPLPPLPDLSPLDDDLAHSPSEDEGAPPAHMEDPGPSDRPTQQEGASYPNLLSYPPPLQDQGLDISSLNDILGPPSPPPPPAPSPTPSDNLNDLTPSVENVTIHSVLFRPPGSRANIQKEEAGESLGSILDSKHYSSVVFLDDRLTSFKIPFPRLIRFMGPILHRCSFTLLLGRSDGP